MGVTIDRPSDRSSSARVAQLTQASLCGIAAVVSILRAFRTDEAAGMALASIAALLALGAAAVTFRSPRWAAIPLGTALLMELTVLLGQVAPPRIVNAIPLVFALGLAVSPPGSTPARAPQANERLRGLVVVASIGLMVPLGFAFLVAPHIIAPFPDIYVSYLVYAVLVTITVVLARRRTWWIVVMPFVSMGLFVLMVAIGVAYRDWGG